ncbi:MAG: aminotransferase class V-fold PLP-dependent enzyme [Nitrososphaerales archaeon]
MNQETIEREFPIKRQTAYLNNASYTPMFDSAISEVTRQLRKFSENGPDDPYYLNFKTGASVAREKLAALLNARAQGIVFAESATQSINLVANGFRLSKGDTIITRGGPTTEHPSDYLPWLYYANAKGAKTQDIPVDDAGVPDLAELDSAVRDTKAKIVVTSHVLYNLGTIEPAEEMCRIAHERGAAFFLDVSQSLGNIPVDLSAIGCDFAAGTASKWLCGPLGVGFLYCKDEAAADQLEPLNFGANATEYVDNLSYKVLSGAARLQEGFRNWAYVYAFAVAMDVWSSFGLEEIRETDMKLVRGIVDRIAEMKSAYRLIVDFHDGRRTCIIPVETIKESPSDVVQRALKAKVTVAQREFGRKKILRISPHFYNDEREVERLFEVL